jgi:hypothetical protein
MANLSTRQVIQKVGIGRATLERWLANGKIRRPKTVRFGRNEFSELDKRRLGIDFEVQAGKLPQRERSKNKAEAVEKTVRAGA